MQFSCKKLFQTCSLLAALSSLGVAQGTPEYPFCEHRSYAQTQQSLQILYDTPGTPASLTDRIEYFSRLFLHKPYALTALGEGKKGKFDQAPLYRFDVFDCQTYVETILALAFTKSAPQFKRCINNIRYAQGKVDFLQRHHFTSPDWNENNQELGLLKDITNTIVDREHHAIARYAQARIDPANWYQHFAQNKIRLCHTSDAVAKQRLQELRQLGSRLPQKYSRIAYIPVAPLLTKDQNSQYLLDQIPNGAIIEIIRPNWDLTQIIGTHLNVSHIGFAIREKTVLYYYQSSSLASEAYKIPLVDYLISMQDQPSIQGINIQIALANQHCAHLH